MKNMLLSRKSWLLACLFFTSAICFAQVTEKWVKRQNGDPVSFDVPKGLTVDHKGNVYITGRSDGKGTNSDYSTVKYDSKGDIKWEKRYNGPGNSLDEAVAIVADHKGNVYVTGWSTGNGTGRDYATIKYNENGSKKWVKRYNGPGNEVDEATAIAVDREGNVYVTGWSTGSGTDLDYTTIKYDDDGDLEWVRRYNGPGNGKDEAFAIAVDNEGNVFVTGEAGGIGTGGDYTTIKYDDDGDLEWVQRYNGPVNDGDMASALAVDDLGNVYVTGRIATAIDEDGNPCDIATIKYNASGIQQWAAIYDTSASDFAKAIAVDKDGNVFITGVGGYPDETFTRHFVTIKYNAVGLQQWAQTVYPQNGDEAEVSDLALDAAGNVYITGTIRIINRWDFVTAKYNTHGVQQWMAFYDGPEVGAPSTRAIAIGLDKHGNVFITGGSRNADYLTIKYSTNGLEKWTKSYNGPGGGGPDFANALAVDQDGASYVTGGVSKTSTHADYATYKYEKDGDREWKKTYNGPATAGDWASAIALDAKENVYVTGRSAGIGTGNDFATIKYDKNGNTIWGKRYNGAANGPDEATAITVDDNGNVYVTGHSTGNGTDLDYATIKYDKDGNIKWLKRYNGPGNSSDVPTAISVDANSNVYVTGLSWGNGTFNDYATIKYGANGNELWVNRYNNNANDEASALVVDASGNVYVTGRSGGANSFDYATIKYNTAGIQQWVARYELNSDDEARAIALDAFGNVYVTGGGSDYATVKYNNEGIQQWTNRYDGPGNSSDIASALALDIFGNVYVTGGSKGGGSAEDYATIKYNSAGEQQWVIRYNGPGNSTDFAVAIALDKNENVYVTGWSTGDGTDYDYATIKYEQTPVLTRSSNDPQQIPRVEERASTKLAAKAFPNAFTEFTNLQWSGSDEPVTITITDAMGRLVEKRTGLASGGTIQTGYRFMPGIYYATIVQGNEKLVMKLIKN